MAEFRRDQFLTADVAELSEHLLTKGLQCSTRRSTDGSEFYIIGDFTAATLNAALADYTPTATPGTYRSPLPGDLPTHVQHLASFLNATAAELALLTPAQRDHVTQDIIRVLKRLVDDRLA